MTDLVVVPQPGDPLARLTDEHGNRPDTCGHCLLLPTVNGWVRAKQSACPDHGDPINRRRVVISGNACCGGNGFEASCEVCRG